MDASSKRYRVGNLLLTEEGLKLAASFLMQPLPLEQEAFFTLLNEIENNQLPNRSSRTGKTAVLLKMLKDGKLADKIRLLSARTASEVNVYEVANEVQRILDQDPSRDAHAVWDEVLTAKRPTKLPVPRLLVIDSYDAALTREMVQELADAEIAVPESDPTPPNQPWYRRHDKRRRH